MVALLRVLLLFKLNLSIIIICSVDQIYDHAKIFVRHFLNFPLTLLLDLIFCNTFPLYENSFRERKSMANVGGLKAD